MPVFNSNKVIFIHIPKCAGTSINKFLDFEGNFEKFNKYNRFSLRYLYGRNLQHLTYDKIRLIHPFKFSRYFKFSFVRNPWDRMASEYRWRRKWDGSMANASFEDMLRKVPYFRKKNEPHFKEQYSFVYNSSDKLQVDYLGRFESLEEDFNSLLRHLRLSGSLPKLNKTKNNKDYQSLYNQICIDLVGQYFSNDIQKFGYKF